VAVADRRLDRPVLGHAVLDEARARLLDQRVIFGKRQGYVVLHHLAELARRLGQRLAQGPQVGGLGLVLRERAVGNDAVLEELLQQPPELLRTCKTRGRSAFRREKRGRRGGEDGPGEETGTHLVVVILVAPARLDEDVERPAALGRSLERRLGARVVEDEVEPLLVPELERRQDLAELRPSLLEDGLDRVKVGD